MTFEQWWETLTPAEQKIIGRTNAKFVWLEASDHEREACAKICEETGWNQGKMYAKNIRARGNNDKSI